MPPRRPAVYQPVRAIQVPPDANLLANTQRLRVPIPLDDPSLSEPAKRALKQVDECLETIDGFMMGSIVRYNVAETIGIDVPAWDCDFMEEIFRYLAERPLQHRPGKLMAQDTLRYYRNEILAANSKVAYNIIPRSERLRIHALVENLINEYSLEIFGYDRAQISHGTLNALVAALPMSGLGWDTCMSQLLFQSIACSTGVRPSSLTRCRAISILDRPGYNNLKLGGDGARLRDFHLWYERSSKSETPQIYGWFLPRGGKTRQSRGLSYSLPPVPMLGLSPAALILIFAGHHEVFGTDGISHLFTGLKGDIIFPAQHLDLPLFRSAHNPTHNVGSISITRTIHRLCDVQGIDGLVDSRCYRSLVAAHIYAKHGAESTTLALGHGDQAAAVTRRYIGKSTPIDIQQAIFQDQGSDLQSLEVNRRNARPRLGAPRKLAPETLQAIIDGEHLQSLLKQQESVKRVLASQKSNPDPQLLKQRHALSNKWVAALTKAIRDKLKEEQNQYLEDLATGQIPTDNSGEEDIITLERILLEDSDLESRPSFALVDVTSIELPTEEDEKAIIKLLFGNTNTLFQAYELLSKTGALSKRKEPINGIMVTRATLAAAQADKAIIGEEEADL